MCRKMPRGEALDSYVECLVALDGLNAAGFG